MKDKFIKVVVTDLLGNEDEDYTTAKVGVDASFDVDLVDDYGLQDDGTGIIGDKLTVVYGATFGVPQNISWYKDGKVVLTRSVGDQVTEALTRTISASTWGTGIYKVTITNVDGYIAETNEIKITDKEEAAQILNFTIEDDYTDGSDIAYKTSDNRAVASITLNKNYDGELAIYKTTDTAYTDKVDSITTSIAEPVATAAQAIGNTWSPAFTNPTAGNASIADGKSILTSNAATNYQVLNATNIGSGYGYINNDGTVTYKFVVDDGALTRGSDYVVTFDQKSISTDKPGTGKANKSDAVTVPYVKTPGAVAVTKAAKGNTPEVTFYNDAAATEISTWFGYENGDAATDQNGVAANAKSTLAQLGISSAKVYSATKATTTASDGTQLAGVSNADTAIGGVWTGGAPIAATLTDAFWFTEVKTTAGIYGASSVTITSGNKQTAQDGASDIDLISKKGDPTTAVVSFADVRNAGKVYIVRGYYDVAASGTVGDGTNGTPAGKYGNAGLAVKEYTSTAAKIYGTFDPKDSTTYVTSADVAVGAASVELANAISNVSTNFVAAGDGVTAATTDTLDGIAIVANNTGNDKQVTKGKKYTNTYIAVFIPNDQTNYGTVYTSTGLTGSNSTKGTAGKDGLTVTQALTSYKLFANADAKVAVKSAYNVSAADTIGSNDAGNDGDLYIAAYDQFGDNMLHKDAVAQADVSLEPVKGSFNGDPDAAITGIKIKTTAAATKAAGQVTLTTGTIANTLKPLKVGNQLSAGLRTGQIITLTVTKEDGNGKIAFGVSIS